jgi:hypothetical protein
MDFLKSAVASAIAKSSSFPVTIGDRIDAGESIWVVHNGVKKVCKVFSAKAGMVSKNGLGRQHSLLPLHL